MTTLLLIRHGETWANRESVFAGFTDTKLTDVGYQQAEKTADFVMEKYNVDKVYASDLMRAFETGKAVADRIGVETIPEKGMREIYGGSWENVKYEKLCTFYPKEYGVWLHDIGKAYCVCGESVEDLGERVMTTLTRIARENEGKTAVVATHATPIRVAQCLIEYGDLANMQQIPWVSNASVTEVVYENNAWRVVSVNKDEHLGELRTVLPSNV